MYIEPSQGRGIFQPVVKYRECAFSAVPSVIWRCWLGGRKGIQPVKNWVVGCWRGYLCGARCRLAYGPVDANCHSLSLASAKSRLVLPFWYWLTQVVPEKGHKTGVCVRACVKYREYSVPAKIILQVAAAMLSLLSVLQQLVLTVLFDLGTVWGTEMTQWPNWSNPVAAATATKSCWLSANYLTPSCDRQHLSVMAVRQPLLRRGLEDDGVHDERNELSDVVVDMLLVQLIHQDHNDWQLCKHFQRHLRLRDEVVLQRTQHTRQSSWWEEWIQRHRCASAACTADTSELQ